MIKKCYPGGKKKAVTFSFDDGTQQDIRLVGLLNKHGLKATFNFNGGKCQNDCFAVTENSKSVWDGSCALRECFAGHEIASHSLTHPNLTAMSDSDIAREISEDKRLLGAAIGYEVRGFAAPYGLYDERTIKHLKQSGICYNRTTVPTKGFSLPEDFLRWDSTGHICELLKEENKNLLSDFKNTEQELACLYLWGHSFELNILDCYSKEAWKGLRDRWGFLEDIFRNISGSLDTWYATNIEIFDYVTAIRKAVITENQIENKSNMTIYFSIDGEPIQVEPNGVLKL